MTCALMWPRPPYFHHYQGLKVLITAYSSPTTIVHRSTLSSRMHEDALTHERCILFRYHAYLVVCSNLHFRQIKTPSRGGWNNWYTRTKRDRRCNGGGCYCFNRWDALHSGISKPTDQWRSGILAIRIEQISGLQVQKIRESRVQEGGKMTGRPLRINHQRVRDSGLHENPLLPGVVRESG